MQIIEQFGISPTLLLAQIVNFAILLFLLQKFLYKPVLKVLEERKTKIEKSIKDAENIEKRLAKTEEEQGKILEKARTEASLMISEAKKESKELSEKMLVETKANVEEMMKRTQERMSLEKEQMLTEVKKDLADLVITATSKVAKKSMTEEDNRKIVEETVKEISNK